MGAVLLVVLAPSGAAQAAQSGWSPAPRLVDSYARTIGVAAAVDPDAPSGPLVYDGAGGDVYLLGHDPAVTPGLQLYDLANGPHLLHTGGVAVDIELTDDFTYVAAFRNGVQVFRRPSDAPVCAPDAPCWSAPEGHDVLDLAAVDVPTTSGVRRLLAVGTERRDVVPTEGSLFLLLHDPQTGLHEIASWDIQAPVYAVAASADFAYRANQLGTNLTVLLGTGCGKPGALQRRDYVVTDASGSFAAYPVLRQGWTTTGSSGPVDMVITDIVLDPDRARAYVAAYWDGVYAFDLHPGILCPDPSAPGNVLIGLCQDTSAGWPLQLANGGTWSCGGPSPFVLGYARCLALGVDGSSGGGPDADRRLYVGLGSDRLQDFNIQYLGNTLPVPCNASQGPSSVGACNKNPVHGVFSWHLDSSDDPVAGPGGVFAPDAWLEDMVPYGLALRQDPTLASTWHVYVSTGPYGLAVLEERPGAGATGMLETADWNGSTPAKMPMPAFDDVLPMSTVDSLGQPVEVLYTAHETGLSAFDLSDPEPLRSPSTGTNALNPTVPYRINKGAILLSGFPNPNGRVFATTTRGRPNTPGGIRFYDLSDPLKPKPAGDLELHREGFGYGIAAQLGMYDPAAPPPPAYRERYVYSVQEYKPLAGMAVEQWTVRLWGVGTANAPIDPCTPVGPQEPCNTCVPCLASFTNTKGAKRELSGLAALEISSEHQAIYTAYNPRPQNPGEPVAPSGGLGVLALEARRFPDGTVTLRPVPGSWPPSEPIGYFEALAGPATAGNRAALVTLHAGAMRLYVAWTGAIAMYDVSVPQRPVLLGARWLGVGDYGLTRSPVRLTPGPSIAGRDYLYVALLNDGVGILDATDAASFQSGPIDYHPMRWQTTLVAPDPRDPTRTSVFVGSGTGGLDQIQFQ